MSDAVIAVRGLRVDLGDIPVVPGLDLAVSRGDIVAGIGVNGAGKSTLLRPAP